MGGQACILYGASEFSRDTDIAVFASDKNLDLLKLALRELKAKRIAIPPFELSYLQKGHAIHFRCHHQEAMKIRIDIMSVIRNVDPFDELWKRRVQFPLPKGGNVEMLSLPDLVNSKKTQRDKDWPMIRRLIEADYVRIKRPGKEKIKFWLMESRTPEMLVKLVQQYDNIVKSLIPQRPLLDKVISGDFYSIETELEREQKKEREADRIYWKPLFKELEILRHRGYSPEEEI